MTIIQGVFRKSIQDSTLIFVMSNSESNDNPSIPPAVQQVDVIRTPRGQWPPGQSGNPEMCWKPGQSGRPTGRPPIGASIVEWANEMQEYTAPELKLAAKDEEKTNRAIAANMLLMARSTDRNASGNFVAIQPVKDLLDRFLGKPTQQVQVTQLSPEQLDLTRLEQGELATLMELLGKATGHTLPATLPEPD